MSITEALMIAYSKSHWWQFKRKRILELAILARYYGVTGRLEKENEIVDKYLAPFLSA